MLLSYVFLVSSQEFSSCSPLWYSTSLTISPYSPISHTQSKPLSQFHQFTPYQSTHSISPWQYFQNKNPWLFCWLSCKGAQFLRAHTPSINTIFQITYQITVFIIFLMESVLSWIKSENIFKVLKMMINLKLDLLAWSL